MLHGRCAGSSRTQGLRRRNCCLAKAVIEALEQRQYLAITPTISGAGSVNQSAAYTLNLAHSGDSPTSWSVWWGDGTVGTGILGTASSATHIYSSGRRAYTIRAKAYSGSTAYNANKLVYDLGFGNSGVRITDRGNGTEYALGVALDKDGNILAAGRTSGGFSIARYTDSGSLDSSFGSSGWAIGSGVGGAATARAITVLNDGSIVAVGTSNTGNFVVDSFSSSGVQQTVQLVDFGGTDQAFAIAQRPGGGYFVGGYSGSAFAVAAFDSSGSLDTSFNGTGKATIALNLSSKSYLGLAVDSGGRPVIAGDANGDFVVARFATGGAPDSSFGSGGLRTTDFGDADGATSVAIQPDGEIVVAGYTSYVDAIARYNPDGTLDTANDSTPSSNFGTNGTVSQMIGSGWSWANAVAIDADGDIVVAGPVQGSGYDTAIGRFTPAGVLDSRFGTGGSVVADLPGGNSVDDYANAMVIQPDGRIVIAGQAGSDYAVARFGAVAVDNFATVVSARFDYSSSPQKYVLQFDQDVSSILSSSSLVLTNTLATGARVPASQITYQYDPPTNTATYSFTGSTGDAGVAGALPEGRYNVLLTGGYIGGGNAPVAVEYVGEFAFKTADANGDQRVDAADIQIFSDHIATFGGATYSMGDFNYDGAVNQLDWDILSVRQNTSLPQAPVVGVSTAAASTTSIVLSWTDNVSGELGWRVQRSDDGIDFGWYKNLPANTTGWTDTGLSEGTGYFYRVRAFGNDQDTAYTAKASAATAVAAPDHVIAVPDARFAGDAALHWKNHSTGATAISIWQNLDGVQTRIAAGLSPDSTDYPLSGLSTSSQYTFVIRAEATEAGVYAESIVTPLLWNDAQGLQISASFKWDYTPGDPAPQSIGLVFNSGIAGMLTTEMIQLENTAAADDAATRVIAPNQMQLKAVGGVSNALRLTFPGVSSGSGILPNGTYQLLIPAGSIVGSDPLLHDFTYDFFFVNGDANHDGTVDVTDLGAIATNWNASPPVGSWKYSEGNFDCDPDGKVDVTDLGILAHNWQASTPIDHATFNVWTVSKDQINISWDDTYSDELGWQVQWSTDGTNFNHHQDLETNTDQSRVFAARQLNDGTRYWFRVVVTQANGQLLQVTPKKSAITVLPAPEEITAVSSGIGGAVVSWQDRSDNEDEFRISRQEDGAGPPEARGSVPQNARSFNDPGSESDSSYTYWVQAHNAVADSAPAISSPVQDVSVYVDASIVRGKTVALGVRGTEASGTGVRYDWSATFDPAAAAPAFSVNNTNAAKTTVATFLSVGEYTFHVTITFPSGYSLVRDVSVQVKPGLASVVLTTSDLNLAQDEKSQVAALAFDQFGQRTSGTFRWSVSTKDKWIAWPQSNEGSASGGVLQSQFGFGAVNSSGLYTAPPMGSGKVTVTASVGHVHGSIDLNVHETDPNLWVWLKPENAHTVAQSSNVGQWEDASGEGFTADSPLTSQAPTYVANALNGVAVVHFDGARETELRIGSHPLPNTNQSDDLGHHISDGFSFSVVFRTAVGSGNGLDWRGGAGILATSPANGNAPALGISLSASGRLMFGIGQDTLFVSDPGFNDNRPHLIGVMRTVGYGNTGGHLGVYIDGHEVSAEDANAGTTSVAASDWRIGSLGAQGSYFTGDISELQVYSQPLSQAQRQVIESRLLSRYEVGVAENTAPTITEAPRSVGGATVTGTSADLAVNADDGADTAGLTYTWSVVSKPNGALQPDFDVNALASAAQTHVTFHQAGDYQFRVVVSDSQGLATSQDVNVTVKQTETGVAITPRDIWYREVDHGDTHYANWRVASSEPARLTAEIAPRGDYGSFPVADCTFSQAGTYVIRADVITNARWGTDDLVYTVTEQDLSSGGPITKTLTLPRLHIVPEPSIDIPSLAVDSVSVTPTPVYTWKFIHRVGDVLPDPLFHGITTTDTMNAKFFAEGEYQFEVTASAGSYDAELNWLAKVYVHSDELHDGSCQKPIYVDSKLASTYQFMPIVYDQFGKAMQEQSAATWDTVGATLGQIDSSTGQYTPPKDTVGEDTVRVTAGGFTSTARVEVAAYRHAPVQKDTDRTFPVNSEQYGLSRTNFEFVRENPFTSTVARSRETADAMAVEEINGRSMVLVGGTYVGPEVPSVTPLNGSLVARFDAKTGKLDQTFGGSPTRAVPAAVYDWSVPDTYRKRPFGGNGAVKALAVQQVDGTNRILAVGTVTDSNSSGSTAADGGHSFLIRYNDDGTIDSSFAHRILSQGQDLQIDPTFPIPDDMGGGNGILWFGVQHVRDQDDEPGRTSSSYVSETFSSIAVDPVRQRIAVVGTVSDASLIRR